MRENELPSKKQVASWIVTGVLIAGAGAALASPDDPSLNTPLETTTTVDGSTTTTEATTTTTEAPTTSTTEAPAAPAVAGEGDGGGNSVAAQRHDCDTNWGTHGAWVAANAHAMKTGETVDCAGPTTTTAAAGTQTVAPSHGKGHAKKK